ncbi:hypothetical protein [Clostridium hydrogeniformans]|uniref:hypothetical protein n=1 Tax=Clostridium hydrogeniformans TaxID=349933 RepID=UPI000691378A|nr:hypothetical protein [Clostridium hydrogeniformans]
MNQSVPVILLGIAIYSFILFVAHEFFRRNLKAATVFFFLTLLSFPLWFGNIDGLFMWGKTILVLVPLCFVNIVRLNNRVGYEGIPSLQKIWPVAIVYVALNANIIEASITDLSVGSWFNFLAGIILCLTIPLPKNAWKIDKKDKYADMVAELPLMWSLLYTTWNACFLYAERPHMFATTLCILIAPLACVFFNKRPDLWFSARSYTLGFHLFIRAIAGDIFTPLMDSSKWYNSKVVLYWGILNLILHVAYTAWYFTKGKKATKISQGI